MIKKNILKSIKNICFSHLAKFKCCFGGDPLPTLVWSHNDSRVSELIATGGATASQYRVHKLHDIHYLDIGPVNVRDSGQLKCTLMNRYGREEAVVHLIVARKKKKKLQSYGEPFFFLLLC